MPTSESKRDQMGPDPPPDGRPVGAVLAGGRGSRLGGGKATAELGGRPLISYPLAALAAAGIEAFVVAKPDTELPPLDRAPLSGAAIAEPDAGSRSLDRASIGAAPGPVEVVREPGEPSHPLVGVIAALRRAAGLVVVLAGDMPFASPALLAALAGTAAGGNDGRDPDALPAPFLSSAPAHTPASSPRPVSPLPLLISPDEPLVVPAPGGRPEPLQARWSPVLLPELEAALAREEPLRRTVAALSPRLLTDAELAPYGDPDRMFLNVNDAADLRRAEAALA